MTEELKQILHLSIDFLNVGEQLLDNPKNIFHDIGVLLPLFSEIKHLDLNLAELEKEILNLSDSDVADIATMLETETVLPNHASVAAHVKQILVIAAKADELVGEIIKLVKGD